MLDKFKTAAFFLNYTCLVGILCKKKNKQKIIYK